MAGFDPEVFTTGAPRGGNGGNGGGFDPDVFSAPKPVPIDVQAPRPRGTGSAAADTANAVGSGFWRGLTRLAGLPADTAANVMDLGKAALGSGYIAATGKAPPAWLELTDRSQVAGSGEHLLNIVRKTSTGRAMVDPVNPDFEGGYAQAIGGGLTAATPGTWGQVALRGGIGAASNIAGKAAFDATGSPEWAILASMLPSGAQALAEGAAKRAVRGGEQGRQEMQRRVLELERAGVTEPTLGLASGNRIIGGAENLLQSTPGAMGVVSRSREAAIEGMRRQAEQAAALASPVRGALPAGQQIQAGIQAFKEGFKGRQAGLYDQLDAFIPGQTPTAAAQTEAALARLNADIPGAPALSRFFKNAKVQAIEQALQSDLGQQRAYTPSQLRAAMGSTGDAAGLNAALNEGTLPYRAVKQTRTMVGNELADHSLLSDVPRSKWSPLYAALSEDMRAAAQAAGPQAERAFSRANDYTRAGNQRLEALRPFADKAAPEQAFTSLAAATRENASVLQAVKKSLPEGARGTVAGTVIERLGRATPGQQNELGDAWSPERFLSNWAAMKPEARKELFSGFRNADQVRADVEGLARAAAMMRENSRLWANPSGTAAAAAARALLFGVPASALVNPTLAAVGAGGIGAANVGARVLTGPAARRFALEGDVRLGLLAPTNALAQSGGGLLDTITRQQQEREQRERAQLPGLLRLIEPAP
ncbi:MAG: hypothetical protein QM750_11750 [Rubrivivax sp.]